MIVFFNAVKLIKLFYMCTRLCVHTYVTKFGLWKFNMVYFKTSGKQNSPSDNLVNNGQYFDV